MNKISRELKSNISVVGIERIKETKTFKKLPKLHKLFVEKKGGVKKIHDGFNISNNISFEAWERQSSERYYIKDIVKELVGA